MLEKGAPGINNLLPLKMVDEIHEIELHAPIVFNFLTKNTANYFQWMWFRNQKSIEGQCKSSCTFQLTTPKVSLKKCRLVLCSCSTCSTFHMTSWGCGFKLRHWALYLCYGCMTGIILWVRPADERRRYIVTSSLIGWVHMGHVTKLWLSCYLVLLSIDSKTR